MGIVRYVAGKAEGKADQSGVQNQKNAEKWPHAYCLWNHFRFLIMEKIHGLIIQASRVKVIQYL